jgi:hypothetical protein
VSTIANRAKINVTGPGELLVGASRIPRAVIWRGGRATANPTPQRPLQ